MRCMYCGELDSKKAIWENGLMYPACNECYEEHAEEVEIEDIN